MKVEPDLKTRVALGHMPMLLIFAFIPDCVDLVIPSIGIDHEPQLIPVGPGV